MCFMGYLLSHGQHPNLTMFDISLSEHHQNQYEDYLKYLQDCRKLAKGNNNYYLSITQQNPYRMFFAVMNHICTQFIYIRDIIFQLLFIFFSINIVCFCKYI